MIFLYNGKLYLLYSILIFVYNIMIIHSIEIINDDGTNNFYAIQNQQQKFDFNEDSLNTLVQSLINTVKNVEMMSNDTGIISLNKYFCIKLLKK